MTNVLEYLENSAKSMPSKVAAEDKNDSRTYGDLKDNARRIGSSISKISPQRCPIIILMEKSVRTLEVMLGVAYAGCFYVLINPDQPEKRAQRIIDTAAAGCIVADNDDFLREIAYTGKTVNYESLIASDIDEARLERIRSQALDIDPLYCNFTSGSTGEPKGVLVSHRSVVDFIDVFTSIFSIDADDVIGNQAPFDFDVSVKDIYSALKTGATITIIPKRMFSVVTELLDYICERKVTTMIWAVSALCLVAQMKGLTYRVPSTVNKILFSGELMPVKYLNMWKKSIPEAKFVNLYGPTEITCNCTYYEINREFNLNEQIPIGKPFPNERVFLLNEHDEEIITAKTIGEICVSGTALALGYYNNGEQTQKRFIQNPLNDRYIELIYRTGDLAEYNEKGELCFAGRKDFQIKYMGHRIELEEIETAANSITGVERACCIYIEEKNKLIGIYSGEIDAASLKKCLYELLPSYMIPAVFYQADKLPISDNGKIDRKKLKDEWM